MQPARLANEPFARAQVQVVRVAQDDFRADLHHFARGHGFYGGRRAHRHISRGVDIPMRGMQNPQPRAGLLAGFGHLKSKVWHRFPFMINGYPAYDLQCAYDSIAQKAGCRVCVYRAWLYAPA